jgi:hypothetical protein
MNTQISSKLAALAVAVMMNSLLIGGVAYLFNAHAERQPAITQQQAAAPAQGVV